MAEETVSFLEMTSRSQLVPGRPPPSPVTLHEVGADGAPVLRSTNVRIGAPHRWRGRAAWTNAQWAEEIERPGVRAWIIRVAEAVAGLVELERASSADVGIVVFGLVPEFVGRGFGGAALTLAVELAWELDRSEPARRVWVQTSSRDHPNALPNYEARGFRVFRTEQRDDPEPTTSEINRGG
jgi:RimJ/RimL family protein N-acetyltransferase